MLRRDVLQKGIQYTIISLPLAAIVGSSFFPLQPITRQFLILASLIWFQVTILFEVF